VSLFVLDASVALAWFIDHPVHAYAVQIREKVARGHGAVVPVLWEMEFANGVLMAERRKLMTNAEGDECMSEMEHLRARSIEVNYGLGSVGDVLILARTFQLTVYDACYLELAKRLAVPLATLDKSLNSSAIKAGVMPMV
jgi:predicted nucleic acid-binding protein